MAHTLRNIAIGSVVVVGGLLAWESISPIKGLSAPGAKAAPVGGNCQFIPGQRYVAAYGNGFIVVINGQQVGPIYNDQATAERAYNAALGC